MRRTKIVCTLGPRSDSPEVIRDLIRAGMDVARLNFSHGTHEDHARVYQTVREVAETEQRNIGILMDLQGPKIRTGRLQNKSVDLIDGATICITTEDVLGDATRVSTTYTALPKDVVFGDRILLADGAMELRVEAVDATNVVCSVVHGGKLGEHKGINLPGVAVSAPCLTAKDREDLVFGLKLGVDFVALSFVRKPGDVAEAKAIIAAAGYTTPVIAKIERPEAVTMLDAVLDKCDGVMVARGDLGVELPLESVPKLQKDIIRKCNARGIPVITATQMLESMIANPGPTRAEVADVANAIYDGTDAVMLSAETAAGAYPVETVEVMARVATQTDLAVAERDGCMRATFSVLNTDKTHWFSEAIGWAAKRMTETLPVKGIVVFTKSGYSARAISRTRPDVSIISLTPHENTCRRCALLWGVEAMPVHDVHSPGDLGPIVDKILRNRNLAEKGDTVIIIAGVPFAVAARTNLLRLHVVGEEAPNVEERP